MISWIQKHLIRHGRWIFLTLLALVVVAFVFTIGNTPGCTTKRNAYQERKFYGYDLNSPREMSAVSGKVSLSSILNTGRPISSEAQFQMQATSRIALLHLADELGIPAPDQEALTEYIKTKAPFRGPDGQFSPDAYLRFVDEIESNPRFPNGLVILVLEEDYRIDQVNEALSGPGYVLPSEVLAQTQRNQTTFKLATAELDYASFDPEISPNEETLKAYFDANAPRYEIPERIQAGYVFFPASKYAAQVASPEETELRAHFTANRARFVAEHKAAAQTPAKDTTAEEETTVTFEDVRDAVLADLLEQLTLRAANEAAQAFAYTLYRDNIKRDSAAFNKVLNDTGVELQPIPPYTREGAAQNALSTEMLQSAFGLSDNRYYSDAYPLEGGYGVLIYEGRIEPEQPAFEDVSDKVLSDYRTEQKRELFNEKGESLKAELEAKIAEGTSLVEAAEALGLKVRTYEAFKASEAPRELNPSALRQAQGMRAGEISPMLTSGGIGTFVYVETKEVPEVNPTGEDFTRAEGYLAKYSAFLSSRTLVNELIARGLPTEAAEDTD